jgi:hypothetical protein
MPTHGAYEECARANAAWLVDTQSAHVQADAIAQVVEPSSMSCLMWAEHSFVVVSCQRTSGQIQKWEPNHPVLCSQPSPENLLWKKHENVLDHVVQRSI